MVCVSTHSRQAINRCRLNHPHCLDNIDLPHPAGRLCLDASLEVLGDGDPHKSHKGLIALHIQNGKRTVILKNKIRHMTCEKFRILLFV
jgi:hypothetical protein